ncbi:manganese ion binding protein [Aureococcus anophagefferens]|nr:manganese ion binding protein [Aureococcus anophagefferens]
MATLTGAQMVATGKHHAGIFTNDEATELAAVAAGKRTGDLVHPLPYAPEFHRAQFQSKVADFKNSVAARQRARARATSSARRHKDYAGAWLHVDIAGPAFKDDRATGFGVALVLGLLEVDGFRA